MTECSSYHSRKLGTHACHPYDKGGRLIVHRGGYRISEEGGGGLCLVNCYINY